MNESAKSIVVLGGGITGLSAAFYLKKMAEERGQRIRITVVEKSGSFGGKIDTLHRDGFVIEKGPDSFLARKLPIMELTRDLGLEDQLVPTNPNAKKTYILHKGKLHRMPPGLVLGIPTEISPFVKTGLLSITGKARAALDLVLPRRTDPGDESLGAFLERRLGKEVLQQIAEPLLAGIYAGDTYALSVMATFPQFRSLEQKYRSLILGMVKSKKTDAEESRTLPEVARTSVFLNYRNGMQTLVNGLVKALDNVKLLTSCGARSVEKDGAVYRIAFENGQMEQADAVIAALPAYVIADLLSSVPGIEALQAIDYSSVANVVMAFDGKDINYPFDGSGFVVPRKEGRFITACTWTSTKWLHTAPRDKVLLRCYIGRFGDERWMGMNENELVRKVRQDIQDIMGIDAQPLFHEITPMQRSMPQYPVGHLERIKRVREQLASVMPNVFVTGAAFHGVGIPDCIRQGKEAAAAALDAVQ
jgi:oxygen-dependent protoporphyrinogen oxidase